MIRDGKRIAITSRPAQSLFAYLILNPGSAEETARDNLHHAIWRIRKALQAASSAYFLLTNDLTIAFDDSCEYWADVAMLKQLGENAMADDLTSALLEYQGELLPGFYEEWVVLEREHL